MKREGVGTDGGYVDEGRGVVVEQVVRPDRNYVKRLEMRRQDFQSGCSPVS